MQSEERRDDSVQVSLLELRELDEDRARELARQAELARVAEQQARQERERAEDEARRRAADAEAAELARRESEREQRETALRIAQIDADARIEEQALALERARVQAASAAIPRSPARPGRPWTWLAVVALAVTQLIVYLGLRGSTEDTRRSHDALTALEERIDTVETRLSRAEAPRHVPAPRVVAPPNVRPATAPPPRTKKPGIKPKRPKLQPKRVDRGPIDLDCDPTTPLCN